MSKLMEKPGETFFPVSRSSIRSEYSGICRRRLFRKYGNFVTESCTATAFSFRVQKPVFRSLSVDRKAQGDFFSHQTKLILELTKFARHIKKYWGVDSTHALKLLQNRPQMRNRMKRIANFEKKYNSNTRKLHGTH